MRLFVAIELPAAVRSGLAGRASRAGAGLPPARRVPADNLHLTLEFLGATDEERLPGLEVALEKAFADQPLPPIRVDGAGCFPKSGRPRVLWAGLEPRAPLARLQLRVARAACRAVDAEPDGRPYRPHVTLARCSRSWTGAAAQRWREAIDLSGLPAFAVDRGVLMESRLSPAGARYRVVGGYPLEPAA